MAMQKFEYFPELPRELQLMVWEFHEANTTSVRHYIHVIEHWNVGIYVATDPKTNKRVGTYAISEGITQSEVPDPAVAPCFEVQPFNNMFCLLYPRDITLATFDVDLIPRRDNSFAYSVWMNFKIHTFCFIPKPLGDYRNVLQYLEEDDGFGAPSSSNMNTLHWFCSIQNLELLVDTRADRLADFDRRALTEHPSLRNVTLHVTMDNLAHTPRDVRFIRLLPPYIGSSVPLDFIIGQGYPTHDSLEYTLQESAMANLMKLKGEIDDVLRNRASPIQVRVMVEVRQPTYR
ncbi:hypothetical protein SCAR479_06406 [Seiridium cardinale]|uniref:Uncharacterized protein n=1 Tax=Seiridium cardinale TaxID=138064 RepID=A0ABR2XTJ1_9PEZI